MGQNSFNVYQMVTDRIVAQMEKGIIPWHQPWNGTGKALNYCTRKPYRGINTCLLSREGEYLTFKQIQDLKGKLKKGAESEIVVFYQMCRGKEKDKNTGEEKEVVYPILRYYRVFHISDTEGIPSKITETTSHPDPIEEAESAIFTYVENEKVSLKFINNKPSDRAYYRPSTDTVVVPMLEQYNIPQEYYSTTFHELVHSTSKEGRCNRQPDGPAFFGSESYSREELVAEIGAAMLCNRVGVEVASTLKNSAGYLQSWLKALKNDNKMIVWAAGRAEKAAKYILGELDENVEQGAEA